MLIGIMSDTHANHSRTLEAVRLLKEAGITYLIHCGDVGAESILFDLIEAFSPTPITAVAGNVDLYDESILNFPAEAGASLHPRLAELSLADKSIAVLHGDDFHALDRATLTNTYDYVFTGHTHVAKDETIGHTRVINPGAVHRSAAPSVATLDLNTGERTTLFLTR